MNDTEGKLRSSDEHSSIQNDKTGFPRRFKSMLSNKTLAWTTVILWMCMIFAFSAQAHSGEITEAYLGDANVSVRKCAHMFEYLGLFVLLRHALTMSGSFWLKHTSLWAFGVAAVYAMTDEFHQSFVPGRSATIGDVMVDSTGALIGWITLAFIVPRVSRINKKR